MKLLFLVLFFGGWTIVDAPFFVVGKLFGVGPDAWAKHPYQ
jgi:hypothetical protein